MPRSHAAYPSQPDRDEDRRQAALTSQEKEELGPLRRENRRLNLEHQILVIAAAWFARETRSVPEKFSSS